MIRFSLADMLIHGSDYSNWLKKKPKSHEYTNSLDIQQGLVKLALFSVFILYSVIGNVMFVMFPMKY